ncbi:VOC family protein [Allokutzneria sp. A3M-2-11 16]|uniref:VOC family protein n=1 Tax=Allokutzneria sp. A3M-2-11 16 TaxID=2962043 RepID=UPI0020B723EA|nr:VOC family protein [Allokutzneria sp. A3M-2-11 16]MCP3801286.1 VOC family protein [Allokutzneria sp. A3M-2-11 16]
MLRTSHVLCRVDDIHEAVRNFADLGFSVSWGSDPKKAHNALIWFSEGPFIEFFEFPSKLAPLRWPVALRFGAGMGKRLHKWSRPGKGWRDLALETDDTDLTTTRAQLATRGVDVSRIFRNGRTRPDGRRVRYQMLAPTLVELPFVVSSYDPPQRPAEVVHPNGATGIAAIRYGVSRAQRPHFDRFVRADRWLRPEPALTTGVIGVQLHGLRAELDPAKLHGTVLTPASVEESQS